jgi:hypothetical protein
MKLTKQKIIISCNQSQGIRHAEYNKAFDVLKTDTQSKHIQYTYPHNPTHLGHYNLHVQDKNSAGVFTIENERKISTPAHPNACASHHM